MIFFPVKWAICDVEKDNYSTFTPRTLVHSVYHMLSFSAIVHIRELCHQS